MFCLRWTTLLHPTLNARTSQTLINNVVNSYSTGTFDHETKKVTYEKLYWFEQLCEINCKFRIINGQARIAPIHSHSRAIAAIILSKSVGIHVLSYVVKAMKWQRILLATCSSICRLATHVSLLDELSLYVCEDDNTIRRSEDHENADAFSRYFLSSCGNKTYGRKWNA